MKQEVCTSCKEKVANANGAVRFKCPSCAKIEIVRCPHCRQIASKYVCPNCEFEGP